MDEVERRVLDEVDARFEATITFLQALVREKSVLGNEAGVQALIFQRLRDLGLNAEKWDLDPAVLAQDPTHGLLEIEYAHRPNVTAVIPAAAPGGRSVIFNGHVDVVSPEPISAWRRDPWAAEIVDDWMVGRGSGDMKAGIAAMLLAVESVRAADVALRGDVILETVIEEECTGNGALACALRGLTADAAIVPEPHALSACLSTVGVIWFRVQTTGRASHAQSASGAINAIEKMIPVIAALRGLETELNADPRPPLYADHPHPINLNVGIIRAGDWPSTVPAACALECRLSCFPGDTIPHLQERVRAAVAAAASADPWLTDHPPDVEFFGFHAEPSIVDPEAPALRMLANCHHSIVGADLTYHPSNATTDQRFFLNQLGIPATSYGPKAENIHAADERVFIPSIAQTARVLALYLLRWCGVAS